MNVSDIRFYISVLLRRLPILVAAMIVAGLAGLGLALTLEPVYRATAKVLLESPRIPADLARTTVPDTAIEQIQIIEQEIKTSDNLLMFARRFRIYPQGGEEIPEADIINDMQSRILFERQPFGGGNMGENVALFAISFDSHDRALSAEVVNYLASYVLSKNAESRTGRADETMQFFEREVTRLGGELSTIEKQILEFKTINMKSLPESADFRRAQQSRAQERIAAIEREEAALRNRRMGILRLKGIDVRTTNPVLLTPEQRTLQELNNALTMQLALLAPGSPKLSALRQQIATLKAQIVRADSQDTGGGTIGDSHQFDLDEVDNQLDLLAREKTTLSAELAALTRSIEATPVTENRLSALQRKRENSLIQYNTAVAKLAQASTAERIENVDGGGRFTLIEAARPPRHAIGPKRRLLALATLAAGTAAGLGIIVLLELMNDTLRRPSDVARVLEAAPLMTIGYLELPKRRGWLAVPRRWIAIAAAALAFLLMPSLT